MKFWSKLQLVFVDFLIRRDEARTQRKIALRKANARAEIELKQLGYQFQKQRTHCLLPIRIMMREED